RPRTPHSRRTHRAAPGARRSPAGAGNRRVNGTPAKTPIPRPPRHQSQQHQFPGDPAMTKHQSTGTRPAWVNDELFPFESRFLELDGHVVHYVDEGSGPTLLLLHGNPTWSFEYREVIRALRGQFRCVALDYPGFGLSSPRPGYRYLPEEHAQVVTAFVDALA